MGEEGGSHGDAEVRWIVDPLDGTLNFVQGFPHWCVSVALWDAEGPVVGCILDPLREDCFLAVRGQGATWNGRPMRVSQQAGLDGAFLATGFAFQLGERWPLFNAALNRVFPAPRAFAGPAAPPWIWRTSPAAFSTATSNWASSPGTSPPAPCWSRRRAASFPIGKAGRAGSRVGTWWWEPQAWHGS